ncbi:MAG: MaoC family dehydratase [Candidatus Velthaea sp.]|jgi:acyl dehydratase
MPYYLEDYAVGLETSFGTYLVSAEEIMEFGRRWDPQPFHVDPVAAARSPFGGLIASGWHTCGMAMKLIVDHGGVSAESSMGGAGLRKLSWDAPVRPGDELRVVVRVLENRPSATKLDRGTIVLEVDAFNQDNRRVLNFELVGMIRRRPA